MCAEHRTLPFQYADDPETARRTGDPLPQPGAFAKELAPDIVAQQHHRLPSFGILHGKSATLC